MRRGRSGLIPVSRPLLPGCLAIHSLLFLAVGRVPALLGAPIGMAYRSPFRQEIKDDGPELVEQFVVAT